MCPHFLPLNAACLLIAAGISARQTLSTAFEMNPILSIFFDLKRFVIGSFLISEEYDSLVKPI
jgi:hypothetical protein